MLRHWLRAGSAALPASLIMITAAVPAAAAGSTYAGWTLANGAGTVSLSVAGFPSGQISTDASGTSVPGGVSAYLGARTPFGQVFGNSKGQRYAVIRPAAGNQPSTTTITFAEPTPATGWGLALGDVDADTVRISATAADGSAVTPDMFGWQGAFNYCQNDPRPSSCAADAGMDVPAWDATTGILTGYVVDTAGASGWFRPAVPLKSITFTFSVQSGNPIYQVWIAALSRTIGGALSGGCGCVDADGSTVWLDRADGSPVASTLPADDGSYAFPPVVAGVYRVRVEPAPGVAVTGTNPHVVDVTDGDFDDADFTLSCPPA